MYSAKVDYAPDNHHDHHHQSGYHHDSFLIDFVRKTVEIDMPIYIVKFFNVNDVKRTNCGLIVVGNYLSYNILKTGRITTDIDGEIDKFA